MSHMPRLVPAAVALELCAAIAAAAAPPASTAVFTLDAERGILLEQADTPVAPQFEQWARRCRVEPGGAIYVLTCPPLVPDRPHDTATGSDREIPVTLALFRDLEETVYLAGCPVFDKEPPDPATTAGSEEAAGQLDPADIQNCRDVSAGQTFATEVEGQTLKIVVRGRQLAFTIFDVLPPPRSISTPYVPTPSKSLPRGGPRSLQPPPEGMPPQSEPTFRPPPLDELSAGRPAKGKPADIDQAKTSLRTGRLALDCSSSRAFVLVDDAYVGACPIEVPLLAGRHTVTLVRPATDPWVREIEIQPGKTLRLTPGR